MDVPIFHFESMHMNFFSHETLWAAANDHPETKRNMKLFKRHGGASAFYEYLITTEVERLQQGAPNAGRASRYIAEHAWIQIGRPYYKVWPSVVEPFTKLNLEQVKMRDLTLPERIMSFRFSTSKPTFPFKCNGKPYSLKAMLVACVTGDIETMHPTYFSEEYCRVIMPESGELAVFYLWADLGFTKSPEESSIETKMIFQRLYGVDQGNWDETFDDWVQKENAPTGPKGEELPSDIFQNMLRIVVATSMIAQGDESLIKPDFKIKHGKTLAEAIEQAKRKGGAFGYNIGRDLQVSPHTRSGCLALYWTGKGRRIPKIRPRRACVVHRDKITKIPTGKEGPYHDTDEICEEESGSD